MAKRRLSSANPPVEPPPDPSVYNGADDELLARETPDDWMARQDEAEGRKHDANESRVQPTWMEDWDPNLGAL